MYLFCCQGHVKHFLENYRFCRKSENDTIAEGEGVMLFASLWLTAYKNRYVTYPLFKIFHVQERYRKEKILSMCIWNVRENLKIFCPVLFEWKLEWFRRVPFFSHKMHWKKYNQPIGPLDFVIAQQWELKSLENWFRLTSM